VLSVVSLMAALDGQEGLCSMIEALLYSLGTLCEGTKSYVGPAPYLGGHVP
jgi:hypothetical protein